MTICSQACFCCVKNVKGLFLLFRKQTNGLFSRDHGYSPRQSAKCGFREKKKNDFSAVTPDPPFHFFSQLIKFALTKHDHSKAGRLFKAFVFLNASNSGRQTLYLYYQMIKFAFPCIWIILLIQIHTEDIGSLTLGLQVQTLNILAEHST